MKLLEDKINRLTKENFDYFNISKDEYTFEDKRTGYLFITTKKYINKLFKQTALFTLNGLTLFTDRTNDSCIITKESNIEWIIKLNKWLDEKGFEEIIFKSFDNYYCENEYVIKSPNGTYFAIYFNLFEEYINVYSLNNIATNLKMSPEGKHSFDEDGFEDIKITLNSKINLSNIFNEEVELSVSEYVEALLILGYIKKGRRVSWLLTEMGALEDSPKYRISDTVDLMNEMPWLVAHLISSKITFNDFSKLLSYKFNNIKISDFYYLYNKNENELLDQNLVRQCEYYTY